VKAPACGDRKQLNGALELSLLDAAQNIWNPPVPQTIIGIINA
jgi:hypothetical protein